MHKNYRVMCSALQGISIHNASYEPKEMAISYALRSSLYRSTASLDGRFWHDEISLLALIGNVLSRCLTRNSFPIFRRNIFIGEKCYQCEWGNTDCWSIPGILQDHRSGRRHYDATFVPLSYIWRYINAVDSKRVFCNPYPGSLTGNQGVVRCVGGVFSSVSSFLVGTIHESSDDGINEKQNRSNFCPQKLAILPGITLMLLGLKFVFKTIDKVYLHAGFNVNMAVGIFFFGAVLFWCGSVLVLLVFRFLPV